MAFYIDDNKLRFIYNRVGYKRKKPHSTDQTFGQFKHETHQLNCGLCGAAGELNCAFGFRASIAHLEPLAIQIVLRQWCTSDYWYKGVH